MDTEPSSNTEPLQNINTFWADLKEKPLWYFGGTLFISAVVFVFTVFTQILQKNAEVAKYNAVSHQLEMEGRKTKLIDTTLDKIIVATYAAFTFFDSTMHVVRQEGIAARPMIHDADNLVELARNGITAEKAVVTTTYFEDQDLMAIKNGFLQDLEKLDHCLSRLDTLVEFMLGNLTLPPGYITANYTNESKFLENSVQEMNLRIMAFDNMFERKDEIKSAELKGMQAPLTMFGINSSYFVCVASAYIGFFIYSLFKAYRRFQLSIKKRSPFKNELVKNHSGDSVEN